MTEPRSPERRLAELGVLLPSTLAAPAASYSSTYLDGTSIYVAGHTAQRPQGALATGTVGKDVDLAVARACARQCLLNILARVRSVVGTLDAVDQVIRMSVFVATTPEFTDLHLVSEGASQLANQIFGPGHVRTTVGVVSLPRNSPVEIDAQVRIDSAVAARLTGRD